jgi:hypothetical protein
MTKPQENLPTVKQTALGLYVSAKEAYEQWKAAPDDVLVRRDDPRHLWRII